MSSPLIEPANTNRQNHHWSLLAATLALCIFLSAGANANDNKVYHYRFIAFGTYIEVMINSDSKTSAQQSGTWVRKQFVNMHDRWHGWNNGLLGKLNRSLCKESYQKWIKVPTDILTLIKHSKNIAIKTRHKFNPAIARLVRLWGFNNALVPHKKPPSATAIGKLLNAKPRMTDIQIKNSSIRCANPAVQLDFGAIAKGYALDQVIQQLKSRGINNMVINAGGDLKAIGQHPFRKWRVAIRDPNNKSAVLAGITIKGEEAVFTSGDYERYFEFKGKRYHHILDPDTGYPAPHTRSVTVVHSNATLADAASTALFIAGPKHWQPMAQRLGLRYVMLVGRDNTIYISNAMHKRIELFASKRYKLKIIKLGTKSKSGK